MQSVEIAKIPGFGFLDSQPEHGEFPPAPHAAARDCKFGEEGDTVTLVDIEHNNHRVDVFWSGCNHAASRASLIQQNALLGIAGCGIAWRNASDSAIAMMRQECGSSGAPISFGIRCSSRPFRNCLRSEPRYTWLSRVEGSHCTKARPAASPRRPCYLTSSISEARRMVENPSAPFSRIQTSSGDRRVNKIGLVCGDK